MIGFVDPPVLQEVDRVAERREGLEDVGGDDDQPAGGAEFAQGQLQDRDRFQVQPVEGLVQQEDLAL